MRPISSVGLVLVLAACSAPVEANPGIPLTVTRFASGAASYFTYSQLLQPERLVIRDQSSWVSAWGSLFPPLAPIPAPPQVDFTKEMVVLAALGGRPSSGFSITIDSAFTTTSGVTVFVGTTSPGAKCETATVLTQPVDIARLPRLDAPVQFQDVPKIENCQ